MRVINALALATLLLVTAGGASLAQDKPAAATPSVAVGSQYDTAHVYIAPADLDRFSDSLVATFGGTKSQQAALTITPTPSTTMWQAVLTPVGTFSAFGFTTPIPYPFGLERTGYLVTNMDTAIQSAKANEADVVVAPFKDPIGLDAISVVSNIGAWMYNAASGWLMTSLDPTPLTVSLVQVANMLVRSKN